MISAPFPNVSFIQDARLLEVEAVYGGRRADAFSTSPVNGLALDEAPVANVAADDIQETEERVQLLSQYVPFAEQAFEERGLTYPFIIQDDRASLGALPGHKGLAETCAELSGCVGIGSGRAKEFECRAFRALHRLVGGWGVCVGHPRRNHAGLKRAVSQFRALLRKAEAGQYMRKSHAASGDYGMDAAWILGREWGGPLIFLQAKNAPFDREKFGADVLRASDALQEWFGHRVDKLRQVIVVCAVNTVLTTELKEKAFAACVGSAGYHIFDCVDIVLAETRTPDHILARDTATEF